MILCLTRVIKLVCYFCVIGLVNGEKDDHLRWKMRNLIKELNPAICVKGVFDPLKRGTMARGKQVVYSSSGSDDSEVSKEVEVSEEERSPSPQPVSRQPGEGTSRSAAASVFDSAKFSTLRNQEWHEEHADLEFIFEMHVSPEVEMVYRISEAFDQLGWVPILTFPTYYYPDLVREFYANIEYKARHSGEMVEFWVRGRRIVVLREHLAAILGCSD